MAFLLFFSVGGVARADLVDVYVETWTGDMADWTDRDAGEMAAQWSSFGQPDGSLMSFFPVQGFPFPETDAVRASVSSSGGALSGDYWRGSFTPYSWGFDFYAEDTLPSALQIRFSGNGSTFFTSVIGQVPAVGGWATVGVSLSSPGDWVGGDAMAFSNALEAVDWIDVQITRSGSDQQTYYLDNFARVDSHIPEPETFILLLVGAFLVRREAMRRQKAVS
ncbi:MAG: hypothetical protein KJ626_11885 [Verrucomicrobia bacterium]|nr:hypothetical protein [Verrucomicrobiota bacterium]